MSVFIRIAVIAATENSNPFLPPKQNQQTHLPINLAQRFHQSGLWLTSWLHLGPALSLWTCQVIARLTPDTITGPKADSLACVPGLALDLLHHHGCFWWLGLLDEHDYPWRTWPAHLAQEQWDRALAGKEKHLLLTPFLPLLSMAVLGSGLNHNSSLNSFLHTGTPNYPYRLQMSNSAGAVAWTREIGPIPQPVYLSLAETRLLVLSASALQSFAFSPDVEDISDKKDHDVAGGWHIFSFLPHFSI